MTVSSSSVENTLSFRSFALALQDQAVDLFRLFLRLPTSDPRAWTEDDRFLAARVAEALVNIEAGARKARLELERLARRKPGRCARLG